ncbi:hypothetical protein D6D13_01679 [Aureobasidium pullulans]|uniref:Uncharacterized protein n=1 Tax=Aureobasidium pullulans TaxID=5580 RepID=A0A4S9D9I0_AURPU|nr:hypothetical protein D6D13_01679 [Aureobasidium pullulans]
MAAAKLCCTAPLRSESPDDMPSRPVRHFKSLANIKTHFGHSKHTPTTTDGLTDENRPIYPADDLELQRIFVAASLPEDHPDALKLRHRKPDVDESIIHSPSFTNKLRRQLSRKSLATNNSDKETTKKSIRPFARKKTEHGFADLAGGYDDDAQSLCLTESRLASLKDDHGMIASKPGHHVETVEPIEPRPLTLDKQCHSLSVPPTSGSSDAASHQRRSQSSSDTHQDFANALTVHLPGSTFMDTNEIWASSSVRPAPPISQLPLFMPSHSQLLMTKSRTSGKHKVVQKESATSLHLHDMQISQHLRTKSQVSDASTVSDPENRNKHASLNSIMLASLTPSRCRSISSFGFGSVGAPTWEQVLEDESSSIYSRRTSTAQEASLMSPVEQPSDFSEETIRGDSVAADGPESRNMRKAIPPVPAERVVSASTGISILASDPASRSDVRLSPSLTGSVHIDQSVYSTTCSLPKSDSSGSLGKLSRFREDLRDCSTVKKTKKRRSVLRILFPKLTRSKLRSTSTPLLSDKTQSSLNAMYDGTGDTRDLLSVPQSSSKPHNGQRAISFTGKGDLMPPSPLSTGSLVVGASLQSRQSMVNYERSLSVAGDNRRRKSTMSGPKTPEPETEDQGNDLEITLHRASPLLSPGRKGTEEALMEKALQQHQLEKAAFLRPSNQKLEVTPSSSRAPIFTSPFGFPSCSDARLAAAAADDLDPLDAEGPPAARRSQSMHDLGPSQSPAAAGDPSMFRKRKRSTIWTMNTVTTKGTRAYLHTMTPPRSWSRYPSHTRERRCSAADRHDGIITRDFALEDSRNVHQTASLEGITSSPKSWPHGANSKRRNWIVKSHSMTFGTVFRYYSNLLTSSAARNRRSSIATSGRLEHPELEVLPPLLPLRLDVPQHLGAKDQLVRAVNHIKDEGHHIKEEGLDILGHHHHSSTPCMNEHSIGPASLINDQNDKSESVHSGQEGFGSASSTSSVEKTISPGMVDGVVESRPSEPDRALSARRLSRMYQACVQLPASLDNTEVERSGVTDDSIHVSGGLTTAGPSQVDSEIPNTGFLTIPTIKPRMYSGPVTRHFPSVTVVDDRKGHWRSVSMMSVDSGKSVRRSTRDLLETVKATQTLELEKLLGMSEVLATEGENA